MLVALAVKRWGQWAVLLAPVFWFLAIVFQAFVLMLAIVAFIILTPIVWLIGEREPQHAVGVVVEPPWDHDDGVFSGGGATEAACVPCVDVRWPAGRSSHRVDELLPAPGSPPGD